MRGKFDALKNQTQAALDKASELELAKKALLAERARLKKELDPLKDEIAKLRPKAMQSVHLRSRLRKDIRKPPILVECYRPQGADEAGTCVRLVNPKNYQFRENKWYPRVPGEDVVKMAKPDSNYIKFLEARLQGPNVDKSKHYLWFKVRKDAFPAFRTARDLALERGWEVQWELLEPGEYIKLGGN